MANFMKFTIIIEIFNVEMTIMINHTKSKKLKSVF